MKDSQQMNKYQEQLQAALKWYTMKQANYYPKDQWNDAAKRAAKPLRNMKLNMRYSTAGAKQERRKVYSFETLRLQ